MSKYLCTFPGKFGDILWSLPTAKYIAEKVVMQPVDFAVMPYYESLLPLIQEQSYIRKAFVMKDWLRTHSNYGDQPWEAPVKSMMLGPLPENNLVEVGTIDTDKGVLTEIEQYERIWHLGYRCHPGRAFGNVEMPLMDFIAYQQGITFSEPMIPFLSVLPDYEKKITGVPLIAMAFNEQYAEQKAEFKKTFLEAVGVRAASLVADPMPSVVDLAEHSWKKAAEILTTAVAFVGDRSANWVIANGLGKLCITFEPHPSRHRSGHLGVVFGCPGGQEFALPFGMPPVVAGQTAAAVVKRRIEERTMSAHG